MWDNFPTPLPLPKILRKLRSRSFNSSRASQSTFTTLRKLERSAGRLLFNGVFKREFPPPPTPTPRVLMRRIINIPEHTIRSIFDLPNDERTTIHEKPLLLLAELHTKLSSTIIIIIDIVTTTTRHKPNRAKPNQSVWILFSRIKSSTLCYCAFLSPTSFLPAVACFLLQIIKDAATHSPVKWSRFVTPKSIYILRFSGAGGGCAISIWGERGEVCLRKFECRAQEIEKENIYIYLYMNKNRPRERREGIRGV